MVESRHTSYILKDDLQDLSTNNEIKQDIDQAWESFKTTIFNTIEKTVTPKMTTSTYQSLDEPQAPEVIAIMLELN